MSGRVGAVELEGLAHATNGVPGPESRFSARVEWNGPTSAALHIDAHAPVVNAAFDGAIALAKSSLTVPGVRPSKMTERIVMKHAGSWVLGQVAHELCRKLLPLALHRTGLVELSQPIGESMRPPRRGHTYAFRVRFDEVMPWIEGVDLTGLSIGPGEPCSALGLAITVASVAYDRVRDVPVPESLRNSSSCTMPRLQCAIAYAEHARRHRITVSDKEIDDAAQLLTDGADAVRFWREHNRRNHLIAALLETKVLRHIVLASDRPELAGLLPDCGLTGDAVDTVMRETA